MDILQVNGDLSAGCCITDDTNVTFSPCTTLQFLNLPLDATETGYELSCNGKILSVTVRLANVCKGCKIALGVIVTELSGTVESPRGFRAITVTPPTGPTIPLGPCTNVTVEDICFILPDISTSPCTGRTFKVRIIAHYMDLCGFVPPSASM